MNLIIPRPAAPGPLLTESGLFHCGWFRWEFPNERPRLPVIRKCTDVYCLNDAFVIGTVVPEGYIAAESVDAPPA